MVAVMKHPKKVSHHDIAVPATDIHQDDHEGEYETTEWRATATIVTRTGKGAKRYLRKDTLSDLLGQVRDGEAFRFKGGITTTLNLGQNEFLLAMAWMRVNGLAHKDGRRYIIPSIEEVRRAWNRVVTEEAVL